MICITPDQVTCQFKGPVYQTQMTEMNRNFFVIINSSFHLWFLMGSCQALMKKLLVLVMFSQGFRIWLAYIYVKLKYCLKLAFKSPRRRKANNYWHMLGLNCMLFYFSPILSMHLVLSIDPHFIFMNTALIFR